MGISQLRTFPAADRIPDEDAGPAALQQYMYIEKTETESRRQIGFLTKMQDLRLYNNNLLELPEEIGRLVWLPALRISANQVRF